MRKIIIINGGAGVGKDTFVKCCQNVDPSIQNISTIDYVKDVAHELGWSGEKDERSRKFLSDLKALLMEYNGSPFYQTFMTIDEFDPDAIVFLHIREPEEIELYKQQIKANKDAVLTLLITNNRIAPVESNQSDARVTKYEYDYIIDNNDTIEALQESAETFVDRVIKEIK